MVDLLRASMDGQNPALTLSEYRMQLWNTFLPLQGQTGQFVRYSTVCESLLPPHHNAVQYFCGEGGNYAAMDLFYQPNNM